MKKMTLKTILTLAALALLLTFTVSGTLAYISTGTNSVTNVFAPAEVVVTVSETFEGGVKSNVSIQNVRNTDAYLRAHYTVNWYNASDDTYYAKAPVAGKDYSIELNTEGWYTDGNYYYWKKPVAPGANSGILIKKLEVLSNATPPAAGYKLRVEIIGQGIQSTPKAAVSEAWGSSVASQLN